MEQRAEQWMEQRMEQSMERSLQGSARAVIVIAVAMAMTGCATPSEPSAPVTAQLTCPLPTNCVSSLAGDPAPLSYRGNAEQGLVLLRATLAAFPEAKIVRAEGLALDTIFTTPAGFQDAVEFRVDAAGGRIDFRCYSRLGLYDWGKNRSRMKAFAEAFAARAAR